MPKGFHPKTEFKKGQVPPYFGGSSWNKGLRNPEQSEFMKNRWKNMTDEEKQKISRKGSKLTEKHKRKLSESLKGKRPYVATDKTKKKMSEIAKKRTGENHPRWKGGISTNYRRKTAPRPMPEYCEICGRTGQICFDHDHKTGKFRGWICLKCNSALGMVEDKPEILIEMIKYLNNR